MYKSKTYLLIFGAIIVACGGSGGSGNGKDDLTPPDIDFDATEEISIDVQDVFEISQDKGNEIGIEIGEDGKGQEIEVEGEHIEDMVEAEETTYFYPSPELFIKILGPSSNHYSASAGSLISVTGIMFGEAQTITWKSNKGEGTIQPEYFWLSDAIELDPGDNLITVTAVGKDGAKSEDYIMVVYTPGFMFPDDPKARPDVVFLGEPQQVVFTIRISQSEVMEKGSIALYSTNPDLSPANKIKDMKDDGQVSSSGDEITNDGVFTAKYQVACTSEGLVGFRVGLIVKSGITSYTAYSPPVFVECVSHVNQSDCNNALQTQITAKTLFTTKAKEVGEDAARAAVVEYLKNNTNVKEAGIDTYGVWALYKSGLLGVLNLSPSGLRGGNSVDEEEIETTESALAGVEEIGSKNAVLMSPYNVEFGENDETYYLGTILKAKSCPTYDLSGPYTGTQATLKRMRQGTKAGIFAVASHGDTFFKGLSLDAKKGFGWSHKGSQEVIFSGEPVSCSSMLTGTKTCSSPEGCPSGMECVITSAQGNSLSGVCVDRTQADLRRGRIAIGTDTYAVLPSFFEKYGAREMPESLVYIGACRSAFNGTLASAFLGSGAKAYVGFTNYVTNKFAGKKGNEFFKALVEEEKLSGTAFPIDVEDPNNKGSKIMLIGSHSLNVSNSYIINEGFERGDLTGWIADGDGRVITKLGATKPVAGKFMAIISSGLGYTTQTGSIEQTFCIPKDFYGFRFYWKFYSEEFHEWCGSQFQDTFTARFINALGQELQIVNVAIDDLCDPNDCSQCCQSGKCVGLIPSDVQFDQGDTHMVPKWQKAKIDVSQFAGKGPVTLSFFCTDKGDSIYDTVILIDALKFQ